MKKSERKSIRFDKHLTLQIKELSERLNQPQSVIIRMLCLRSLNELKDDEGNLRLPKQEPQQETFINEGKRSDNGSTIKKPP